MFCIDAWQKSISHALVKSTICAFGFWTACSKLSRKKTKKPEQTWLEIDLRNIEIYIRLYFISCLVVIRWKMSITFYLQKLISLTTTSSKHDFECSPWDLWLWSLISRAEILLNGKASFLAAQIYFLNMI